MNDLRTSLIEAIAERWAKDVPDFRGEWLNEKETQTLAEIAADVVLERLEHLAYEALRLKSETTAKRVARRAS